MAVHSKKRCSAKGANGRAGGPARTPYTAATPLRIWTRSRGYALIVDSFFVQRKANLCSSSTSYELSSCGLSPAPKPCKL